MNIEHTTIDHDQPEYPEAVEAVLPGTCLHAYGDLALFSQRGVGICGSRDASPQALRYAYKFGKEAARQGLVVVSGYARGIDRQAHKGALDNGGATIAVLPEGIRSFRVVRELKPLVDFERNFLAVSMFEPDAVWTSWRAMQRNKLIVALSTGIFVVEARETGGTINCAMECVRQAKPLWAIAYSKPSKGQEGNLKLLQEAALPLKLQGDLKRALEDTATKSPVEIRQLAMNLR